VNQRPHRARLIAAVAAAAAAALAGCAHTSYLLVAGPRAAVSPADVTVYSTAPASYEEIAVFEADGRGGSTFADPQRMSAAVGRLKSEAARLGANGVLIAGGGAARAIYVRQILVASIAPPPAQAESDTHDSPQATEPQTGAPKTPPQTKSRPRVAQSARRRVVGATFGPHPQGLAVLGIDKNGVAARAGLKVGDLITEIDGRATAPIYWEYAAALLTSSGNTVTVKVLGRGELVLSFSPVSRSSSAPPAK
jgi:membrane-associated protease RseP (regulator of RpoE activity)